jgi:HTH-type transcriptional regulator/antitoxin HigA
MDIRPIRTDEDHRAALAEIACLGAREGTERATSSMCCSALVDLYETKRWLVLTGATEPPAGRPEV